MAMPISFALVMRMLIMSSVMICYHNDNHCDGYGTGHISDQHKDYNDDHDPVPDHEADYHDHDDGDIDYDLCQGNCYNQDHDHDDHDLHDHQYHDNGEGQNHGHV